MKKRLLKSAWFLPYVALVAAMILSSWTFLRTDTYRAQTDTLLNRTFEIQWRAAQIREQLAIAIGNLRLAMATGKLDPEFPNNIRIIDLNIRYLRAQPGVEDWFEAEGMRKLGRAQDLLQTGVKPFIDRSDQYSSVLSSLLHIKEDMIDISGAAVDQSTTLSATSQIRANAQRNTFLFAMAVLAVILAGLFMHQRALYERRKDHHIRSFSTLFAHMTRTRIAALMLFLEFLKEDQPPDMNMVGAARKTASELDTINAGLLRIAYSTKPTVHETLGSVIHSVISDRKATTLLDIDDDAARTHVPNSQFHLIIDELIANAEVAVKDNPHASIGVYARVKRPFLFRPQLILRIKDNGIGMNENQLKLAVTPFYSTRDGGHVGLGLSGCVEMVRTMAGKLKISSAPGAGTEVTIRYPLRPANQKPGVQPVRA
ncbi:signal transduction histidine kinase [Phyllobacterium myrsinacearum]|uniref:ATP-binding protein n=1 Tax=Phyllobacterium myrsinacearum TaxID=28101 RepID=UPI00102A1C7C|nr:HAMP domain-containing sensor histidine kinase [Phyllobacterium myrsinacearum]RZS77445.1 signal transduction histidine kinase [Phyllobacterium myrsinacearum]